MEKHHGSKTDFFDTGRVCSGTDSFLEYLRDGR